VLNIFEEEGLENVEDPTVDGGRVSYREGAVTGDLFGGTVRGTAGSDGDRLLGANAQLGLGGNGRLLVAWVDADVDPPTPADPSALSLTTVGLDLPYTGEKLKVYGEFSRLKASGSVASPDAIGRGLYLESGLLLRNTSIQVRFKEYDDFRFAYHRPPPLEPEYLDLLAPWFNTDTDDMVGLSGRIERYFPRHELLVQAGLSWSDGNQEVDPITGGHAREIVHYSAGVEKRWGNQVYLKAIAGYREEQSSLLFPLSHGSVTHYQWNMNVPVSKGLNLEADYKDAAFDGVYTKYYDHRYFLSLHYPPYSSLTILMDRSNNPETVIFEGRDSWVGMQVQVRFLETGTVRVLWGSFQGKVVCSGGICRYLPPFRGLRIETIFKL
jgi:hypothetical protein